MQVTGNNKKICVRVGLRGFTYGIDDCAQSSWLGADRIFSVPSFKNKFETVEISVFTPKFTLVPKSFFDEEQAREILSRVVTLDSRDKVHFAEIPEYAAVGVFAYPIEDKLTPVISKTLSPKGSKDDNTHPEQYHQILDLDKIKAYNKIIASYCDNRLYLTIAQGKTLLLSANYEAPDFTSAEYYIFYALKKFQLNPEISTVFFRTPLSSDEELSLYSYFRSVGNL